MTRIEELWNEYVPEYLLPRLHGYEILMAPYAIAHLKVGLKLYETGYRFGSDNRARIYLTNALEPAQDFTDRLEFAIPALAHEAQAVNEIKRAQRFTVVVGNPPYSIRSSNLTVDARRLVELYKFIDGERIVEKGALQLEKNLNDDYVKFFGLIEKTLVASTVGIAGIITNHAFLDNPTFRGFRWNLSSDFHRVSIIDLHGNSKKKEQVPSGEANENVFDVQQGVAISVLRRLPLGSHLVGVTLAEQWGTREEKYRALSLGEFDSRSIQCVPPWFKFGFQDAAINAEFDSFLSLVDVMPLNSTGIKTHRDAFVLDFDEGPLRHRIAEFRGDASDADIEDTYGLKDTHGWRLVEARRRMRARSDWGSSFRRCLYRPFDIRHIYYSGDLVELPRTETMQHLVGRRNVALLATRQVTSPPFNHVLVTRLVNEMKTCSHDRGTNCFPLYLEDGAGELQIGHGKRPNFSADAFRVFEAALSEGASRRDGQSDVLSPEDLLDYMYAVFHSPTYRSRYAEILKIDFPRVPLPAGPELFRELATIGSEFVALHLMESPKLDQAITTYDGPRNPPVGRVGWSDETVWLDASATKQGQPATPGTNGFRGVSEAVWRFQVGGYQVCHKWLKDRKGRTLSEDDIAHYQKIVVALSETIRLMQEIDEVIDEHGGWPGAFVTSQNEGTG